MEAYRTFTLAPALRVEAHQAFFILREGIWKNFDRHIAIQFLIARAIDLAHATGADLGDDRIVCERCVGGNGFAHFGRVGWAVLYASN